MPAAVLCFCRLPRVASAALGAMAHNSAEQHPHFARLHYMKTEIVTA